MARDTPSPPPRLDIDMAEEDVEDNEVDVYDDPDYETDIVKYTYEDPDYHSDGIDYTNRATPLFDFIRHSMSEIIKDAEENPVQFPGYSNYKAFWREKFDQLRHQLAASQESDLLITDPPLKKLEIEVLDFGEMRGDTFDCPCCLSWVEDDFVIEAEGGITRDIFLKKICDFFYGEDVEKDWLPLADEYGDGRLVVRDVTGMVATEGHFLKNEKGKLRLWLYCGHMPAQKAKL